LTFIAIYFIATLLNGEFNGMYFFKYFFGRYFICLIAVYVIYSSVGTNEDLHRVLIFLIFIGIINGLFSVLQFFGNDFGISITRILINAEGTEEILYDTTIIESGLNKGVRGLFGFIARNGYFSAVFACLAPYLIIISKSMIHKIISVFVAIFLVYVVFLTQQRLVLLLTLLFYAALIIRQQRSIVIIAGIFIIGFTVITLLDFSPEQVKLGRYSDFSDPNRIKLYSLGLDFIKANFWFGGQGAFSEFISGKVGRANSAHNFFLNGFIYSGVFGASIIISLYFKILVDSLRMAFLGYRHAISNIRILLGGSLVVYLLNSLTHNSSLITGDEFIWILYILLIKADTFYKENVVLNPNEDFVGN
jgi:hypothetical protein